MRARFSILEISVGIIIVLVIIYFVQVNKHSDKEQYKIEQMIPPVEIANLEAGLAIKKLVDLSQISMKVRICKSQAHKKVTIRTTQPVSMKNILEVVFNQLEGEYRLHIGQHGEIILPTLHCNGFDELLTIECIK
jgi:hypothetical protein